MTRPFVHVLRLGTHAEQEYVIKGAPLYDRLMLNANLVEATASALAVLITRIQKPYFIDPVTYAYGLSPSLLLSKGSRGVAGPKRTFVALAEKYGLPSELVGRRPIAPGMVRDDLGGFVRNVIEYQRTVLASALEDDAAFVLSDIESRVRLVAPATAIPPYFVEDFSTGWGEINLASVESARALRGSDLAPTFAVDSRLATPHNVAELGARLSEVDVDFAFLWFTDLDEHSASTRSLRSYAGLVEALATRGKRLFASYGGFFSLLLAFRGLHGSSHGIGYGDKRDLEPVVGGGLPPARYYLPAVRDGISLGDLPLVTANLSVMEFRERVCDCSICEALLERGGVEGLVADFTETEDRRTATGRVVATPTSRVYKMSRWHYLQARAAEFDLVRTQELDAVLARLRSDANWAGARLGYTAVAHIDRWIEAVAGTDDE